MTTKAKRLPVAVPGANTERAARTRNAGRVIAAVSLLAGCASPHRGAHAPSGAAAVGAPVGSAASSAAAGSSGGGAQVAVTSPDGYQYVVRAGSFGTATTEQGQVTQNDAPPGMVYVYSTVSVTNKADRPEPSSAEPEFGLAVPLAAAPEAGVTCGRPSVTGYCMLGSSQRKSAEAGTDAAGPDQVAAGATDTIVVYSGPVSAATVQLANYAVFVTAPSPAKLLVGPPGSTAATANGLPVQTPAGAVVFVRRGPVVVSDKTPAFSSVPDEALTAPVSMTNTGSGPISVNFQSEMETTADFPGGVVNWASFGIRQGDLPAFGVEPGSCQGTLLAGAAVPGGSCLIAGYPPDSTPDATVTVKAGATVDVAVSAMLMPSAAGKTPSVPPGAVVVYLGSVAVPVT